MVSKCLREIHTHIYLWLSLIVDECLKNFQSFSHDEYSVSHTEVLSGRVTQSQNNGLPIEKRLSETWADVRTVQALMLYCPVTAGYTVFVVTLLFSSLVIQLRKDLQHLSSDDHVIQWICLSKNNVSSDEKTLELQEARGMILGSVPLTTSLGLCYPLLMWNAYILFLLNKLHVPANSAAKVVKDILNTSTYTPAVIQSWKWMAPF